MTPMVSADELDRALRAAGFADDELLALARAGEQAAGQDLADHAATAAGHELAAHAAGCHARAARALLARLPARSLRSPAERIAGEALLRSTADRAWRLFARHRAALYDRLTAGRSRWVRVEELLAQAAQLLPGVLPGPQELAAEAGRRLADKDGVEVAQGLLVAQWLADPVIGRHLCLAMLRPTAAAIARREEFERAGELDLGCVRLQARGEVGYLNFHHPRFLNAEDDETLAVQELACDLILLHPGLRMGVLRGDAVEHPRHRGRRIFSAGLNLTRLYHGQLSNLFYLVRDLGLVNKLYRGLLVDDDPLAAEWEETLEKPWLAVVEGFAIGGGCQLLLVMDHVIAASGAWCNLPARKEGIIPGCANLRLSRRVGERLAREAILFDRSFPVDAPQASGLVDQVCAPERIDAAVEDCVRNALGSGMVSAAGNRRALRIAAEPLDLFRAYMADYAREQAWCLHSEQLVANLERNWKAAQRPT